MTQALTKYQALYASVISRRNKPPTHKGLDLFAAQVGMRVRHRSVTLSWLRRQAEMADALAPEMRNCSEAALDDVLMRLREGFVRGTREEEHVRRALAAVREVARRDTGEEAYIVQLMGALALYHGRIIEMVTGEGKTLTGSIAAPLLAWRYRHLHVFTVNDYLAARDAASRSGIYKRCGCDVGAIVQDMAQEERFGVYARPIIYGTPKQITADWLRDQLRLGQMKTAWFGRKLLTLGPSGGGGGSSGPMVPGLRAAMVDECDAVLIDEAVVPLIIARSRREDEMGPVYREATEIARRLDEGADYKVDHLRRKADLTRRGKHRVSEMCFRLDNPIWRAVRRAEELVRQALVARHCYRNGHQYQVVDGRVVIVDEYTGRFLADRNWEHGLHQSVEAKEGIDVTADRETLARVSFQRFFRMYPFLCGMTGTAADGAGEMERVYERPVTVVPTNRPIARERMETRVFKTSAARWDAVVESIEKLHEAGHPVLVGTRSIEASEFLGKRLEARGLSHRVLNANFDKDEADLISLAGKGGRGGRAAITVATNMAGRGTDIKPDPQALEVGGLHVMLTEMHTAQRIDRQFIGRAGRQGDPGSSQIFVSLEDELVKLHARSTAGTIARSASTLELAGTIRAVALRVFRLAQRRAEARGRMSRREVLRQDDWMDKYLPGW